MKKTTNSIKILQKNVFQNLLQDYVKKKKFFFRNEKIKIPQRARDFFCHLSYFFWNPYYQKTINPKKKSVKKCISGFASILCKNFFFYKYKETKS